MKVLNILLAFLLFGMCVSFPANDFGSLFKNMPKIGSGPISLPGADSGFIKGLPSASSGSLIGLPGAGKGPFGLSGADSGFIKGLPSASSGSLIGLPGTGKDPASSFGLSGASAGFGDMQKNIDKVTDLFKPSIKIL